MGTVAAALAGCGDGGIRPHDNWAHNLLIAHRAASSLALPNSPPSTVNCGYLEAAETFAQPTGAWEARAAAHRQDLGLQPICSAGMVEPALALVCCERSFAHATFSVKTRRATVKHREREWGARYV